MAIILICSPAIGQEQTSIWAPRHASPAFVEPGTSFEAVVLAGPELAPGGWHAELQNDLRSFELSVSAASYDAEPRSWAAISAAAPKAQTAWRLKLTLPASVPPELLRLKVENGAFETSSERSVSVVTDLEADFYALVLSDEQAWRWYLTDETGNKSFETMVAASPVVGIIHPRFVLNTGDLIENPWMKEREARATGADKTRFDAAGCKDTPFLDLWDSFLCTKRDYQVPTISMPGNHDVVRRGEFPADAEKPFIETWDTPLAAHQRFAEAYEAAVGPRVAGYKLGSFFLLASDFYDDRMQAQAKQIYEESLADPTISYRVISQHHDSADAFLPEVQLGAAYDDTTRPNLMLIGHQHNTEQRAHGGYDVLVTTAALHSAAAGFVEFHKNAAGRWETSAVDDWEGQGPIELVGAAVDEQFPANVTLSFDSENDGSLEQNGAKVVNHLNRRFFDARVRFLMRSGSYAVTGGERLAEYEYPGGHTAVLVRVDLAAGGESTLALTRTGDPVLEPAAGGAAGADSDGAAGSVSAGGAGGAGSSPSGGSAPRPSGGVPSGVTEAGTANQAAPSQDNAGCGCRLMAPTESAAAGWLWLGLAGFATARLRYARRRP